MAHEKSVTVFVDGSYAVVDTSGPDAGRILKSGFKTQKAADAWASKRSKDYNKGMRSKAGSKRHKYETNHRHLEKYGDRSSKNRILPWPPPGKKH